MNTPKVYKISSDGYYYIPRRSETKYLFICQKYICDIENCNAVYKTKHEISYHYTRKHFRNLQCPKCEYVSCGCINNLRQHYGRKHLGTKKNRTHWVKEEGVYKCNKCEKVYKSDSAISSHVTVCNNIINGIKDIEKLEMPEPEKKDIERPEPNHKEFKKMRKDIRRIRRDMERLLKDLKKFELDMSKR